MADDAVRTGFGRGDAADIEVEQFVAAAGSQEIRADPLQAVGLHPHFLVQFAVHGGFRVFAILDQAGGEFDQHGLDAGDQSGKPELLDQDDGVGDGVIRHERDRAASAPEFPGAGLGHRPVEAAVAETDQVDRETAAPGALLGVDEGVGVERDRGWGAGGHGRCVARARGTGRTWSERVEMAGQGLVCYAGFMTPKILSDALGRVETWPEEAQEELAILALEMDAALKGGTYFATPDELAGIDRGLRAAEQGRFVTPEDVEAIFAKHRPA
jgi:hypothetical protein